MKTLPFMSGLLCLTLVMPLLAAEDFPTVEKGDTIATVVEKLGKPAGVISARARVTYFYDQGTIDFITGRVERAFLQTKDEVRQRKARELLDEQNRRQQADAERIKLINAGKEALAKSLEDMSKSKQPASERLEHWRQFKNLYPYTDVSDQITRAEGEVNLEQRNRERATTLVAMNERTGIIQKRLIQLDADYAASLTHWKRAEIVAERVRLKEELATLEERARLLNPAQ